MTDRPTTRYSAAMQILHWLTAIVVLAAFIHGPGGSEQRVYAAARDLERQLHETPGLCVIALVMLRIVWRDPGTHPAPSPAPAPAPATATATATATACMTLAARSVQAALHVLLFTVPFTAVAGAWLSMAAMERHGARQVREA